MHRPQKPQAILTAANFQTDTGLELRVGFSETNLIHSELSRKGDAPLLARAEDSRRGSCRLLTGPTEPNALWCADY